MLDPVDVVVLMRNGPPLVPGVLVVRLTVTTQVWLYSHNENPMSTERLQAFRDSRMLESVEYVP